MYECKEHMSVFTTGLAVARHSLRNGVNGLYRARPGETGFCVTVTCEIIGPATLAPATRLGRQAHTPLPSAETQSSDDVPRPSHPVSTFGDDWPKRPLIDTGCANYAVDLGSASSDFPKFGIIAGTESRHSFEMSHQF
jgi:hypothetical protein